MLFGVIQAVRATELEALGVEVPSPGPVLLDKFSLLCDLCD